MSGIASKVQIRFSQFHHNLLSLSAHPLFAIHSGISRIVTCGETIFVDARSGASTWKYLVRLREQMLSPDAPRYSGFRSISFRDELLECGCVLLS